MSHEHTLPEPETVAEKQTGGGRRPSACSVVVTRYPTGCLGLDYQGSPFFWWCFDLKEMLAKIDSLGIKRSRVKWQERYYHNGRYLVPSDYRLRPWNPRNK
jgi:hypothetical protein